MDLLQITGELVRELDRLRFTPPVAHVYNPLVYARQPHEEYLRRYGNAPKETVFVGMNPGPWGMAQTGVPFGEISVVREWLGIDGSVERPADEHPKKRVTGFACRRSEVSGRRLWGLIRSRYGTPGRFFARFFVLNYCPLLFLDADGRNITPDKLRPSERELLNAACDRTLRRGVEFLQPSCVVGVGNFAADQAARALAGTTIRVGRILHPSPANPAANKGWEEIVLRQLAEQKVPF
ncbi:uracil-DNA glycosylase family protein [Geobacter sp. AOG1]|uniref:uracil-DNA glycosylase family protein n=1 Tax=Geobacter sp. AOG1 TaxID=1566346 RepID=UPI001CC3E003|nr:uracil-DNA glycosylase family protein [Geobacter sp. AOG1]GFE57416.1 single-strand selective monofunctional uracil DNA glycosylase [Geobacter sp. AOG1]